MEDILDLYHEPYDSLNPVICFDELPYQMLSEVNEPLPMKKGKPKRVDFEYQREGSCNIFMFFEPKTQWRMVKVTPQRKKEDFAQCMKELIELFPMAESIRVVLDNLNTHSPGAFYHTFEPKAAREMTKKLDFHYTPVHGSWLNMAEIEFSALSRQSLKGRLGDIETVSNKAVLWAKDRTAKRIPVNWCFSTQDARKKLERLYLQ